MPRGTEGDPSGEIHSYGNYRKTPMTSGEVLDKYVHTDGEDVGRTKYDSKESIEMTDNLAAYEYIYRAATELATKTGEQVAFNQVPEYEQLSPTQKKYFEQEYIDSDYQLAKTEVRPGSKVSESDLTRRLGTDIFNKEQDHLVDTDGDMWTRDSHFKEGARHIDETHKKIVEQQMLQRIARDSSKEGMPPEEVKKAIEETIIEEIQKAGRIEHMKLYDNVVDALNAKGLKCSSKDLWDITYWLGIRHRIKDFTLREDGKFTSYYQIPESS
jgi:hypothetical protein